MIRLSFGQQQRLKTLCQNNRRPLGIPQPRWDDLLEGYLTTLNEIDLVVLMEAMGSKFSRAMKRSQDELMYMRRRVRSDGHS
ncbi:MAG: hypothetical protein IIA89_05440 [Chloroflexi bacterium]|nr:hypothetical protein [Chloroflexota bacterium]